MAIKIISEVVTNVGLDHPNHNLRIKDTAGNVIYNDFFSLLNPVVTDINNFVIGIAGQTLTQIRDDWRAAFDYSLTQQGMIFTSEVVGNFVYHYIGSNSTTEVFEYGEHEQQIMISSEEYTFPTTPTLINRSDEAILSRSPWFFKESPTILYDQMKMDVFIYRGDKLDVPTLPSYQASKFVVQVGQPTISIDIHKLVNDFTQNEYLENNTVGVATTSQKDSVWIFIDAGIYLDGVLKYSINQTLLALDGYGYYNELANPILNKKVLSTVDKHIVYNNSKYFLYFQSKELYSIIINGVNVPFTLDANFNNQFIGGVDVMQYAGVSANFNALFTYPSGSVEHNIEVKTECRNNLINCVFKNKYGVYQKIPFNKLSKKTIEIESEDYMPFVSNFGSYELNKHNKRSYLTNGKEKVICNTDFLPEYYNELFKEMLLSEQIYLEENNEFLPVNIAKKSLTYKTKLNDKLIQYAFEFDYSFNEINKVL